MPNPSKSSLKTKKAESHTSDDGKGKSVVLVPSKEEIEQKEDEEMLKGRKAASLLRQGQVDLEGIVHMNKVWSEDTTRSLGFGEVPIFERLPRVSYNFNPEDGNQLDLLRTLILFKVRCFSVKTTPNISTDLYKETLD